jgi:hypothetical protein
MIILILDFVSSLNGVLSIPFVEDQGIRGSSYAPFDELMGYQYSSIAL